MTDTIEVVRFSTQPGTTAEQFVAANEKLSVWVRRQPGFKYRALSSLGDDQWQDVIFWHSLDDAKAAGDKIMAELGDSECMRLIIPESVQMSHGAVHLSVG